MPNIKVPFLGKTQQQEEEEKCVRNTDNLYNKYYMYQQYSNVLWELQLVRTAEKEWKFLMIAFSLGNVEKDCFSIISISCGHWYEFWDSLEYFGKGSNPVVKSFLN